jgi:RNA polymerase sigma-B factor
MVQQLLSSPFLSSLASSVEDQETQAASLDDGRAEALLAEMATLPEGGPDQERLRAELVTMHMGYVRAVARRYGGRGEPLEDIEQAAMVGLVKAINRFDASVGERFLAYATVMVTGEVKRHFRDRTWMVRVPRRVQELRLSMRDISCDFVALHRRSPTVPEIAGLMGIPEEEVIEVLGANDAYHPTSLDTPLSDAEGASTLADLLGADDGGVDSVVDHAALGPLLARLPGRDQRILLLRFWGNQTQSQIADQLGISQMHVSRLISRSLAWLRTELLREQ